MNHAPSHSQIHLRQKKGFLTLTPVFKTGLVEKCIHRVLHSYFLGQQRMILVSKDDGKKLLLIFRLSFARVVLRNTSTAKCCQHLWCEANTSPSCSGHACAGSWQTTDVQSKFTSYSTAHRVTPRFRQHCRETLLLVLNLKLAHEMQKNTNYKTYSKPLPRAQSHIKLHLHGTLGLCIIYPYPHSAHSNQPLLRLL